jgi:hypothetical protein
MYCGLRLINSAVSLPASLGPRLPAGRAAEGPPSMALLFCFQALGAAAAQGGCSCTAADTASGSSYGVLIAELHAA